MKTSIQILGVIALTSSFGLAEEGGKDKPRRNAAPNPAKLMEKLDTDANGSVSLAEFKAGPRAQKSPEKADKAFAAIDADSNGEITTDEFAKHMAKHGGGDAARRPNPAKMIEHLDKDGNGSVSLAEFKDSPRGKKNPEMAAKIFAKLDADSDGEITKDEFAKARPRPGERDGKKKGERKRGGDAKVE